VGHEVVGLFWSPVKTQCQWETLPHWVPQSAAVFRRTFEFRDFLDHALTQFVFRISGLLIDCAGSATLAFRWSIYVASGGYNLQIYSDLGSLAIPVGHPNDTTATSENPTASQIVPALHR